MYYPGDVMWNRGGVPLTVSVREIIKRRLQSTAPTLLIFHVCKPYIQPDAGERQCKGVDNCLILMLPEVSYSLTRQTLTVHDRVKFHSGCALECRLAN